MLGFVRRGKGDPALVLMPFLGGSRREWDPVVERLREQAVCVGIDLPGFGESRDVPGYSVEAMAESLCETIVALALQRFVLVGHSMAAKVSAVVARWAADGDARVAGLEGLVLVSPSPPGPEPMSDKKRSQMLDALGGEPRSDERGRRKHRGAAEQYIRENSVGDLAPQVFAAAVNDVLSMNRAAWRAWLEGGSKEDWSERVGVLRLPVLLVAGDKDGSLGPEVQRTVSMPHWPRGRLASLHSNHLIPMEKPTELARLIAGFLQEVRGSSPRAPVVMEPAGVPVDPAYVDLILSDRVSELTRRALEVRAEADDPAYEPQALSVTELAQMRALVDRVLPQRGAVCIDLGARMDKRLGSGKGDGWRYALLPEDAVAYHQGLATLEWHAQDQFETGWLALDGEQRDELLAKATTGRLDRGLLGRGLLARLEAVIGAGREAGPALDAEGMQRWFEEVRADVTKMYAAHPATLARMGYSGIADGADSEHGTGFVQIGEGEVEAWEPWAKAAGTMVGR